MKDCLLTVCILRKQMGAIYMTTILLATILLAFWTAIGLQFTVEGSEIHTNRDPLLLGKPHLQIDKDKPFKIALMADLHYGENAWTDWGPQQDVNSNFVQDYIIDVERPDFVIYLGDQVTANNILAANSSKYWVQLMDPVTKRSIPHASVLGNHDDAFMEYDNSWFGPSGIPGLPADNVGYYHSTTREELTNVELAMETSLTQAGPKSLWPSMSNYVLPVSSQNSPGSVAVLLYFLDSGGGSYPELLSAAQIAWFKTTANSMNPSGRIPELIFFHIPTATHEKIGPKPNRKIYLPCVGSINLEAVAPQVQDRGIVEELTKRKSVKAVFSGHNHGLDWCCPHQSLWLCFARHTGYGGYGTWTRGSRILELVQEPNFGLKSWIRLETGEVAAAVNLV
ncbi:hypothetical protein Mapa_007079 [Marchantia paleacea]|nr:hypothetical protein Mapa_007079 [Marchantia paleacea]